MRKRIVALLLSALLLPGTVGALTVEEARQLVEALYIYDVDPEVLARPTVEELFAGLDQYSNYFTPEEYRVFTDSMNDVSQVGLGITYSLTEDGTGLRILEVYRGGAAANGGILPGDLIVAVDGKVVSMAASLEEIVSWFPGEEGSPVILTVQRKATGRQEELTLKRASFTIPYTTHELREGKVGYIRCRSFGKETYDHFTEALDALESLVDHWIIDLRGNSGGDMQAAIDVAGIFCGNGTQSILERRGNQYFSYQPEGTRSSLRPVIVLVDGGTASAAEMLAAAIRDGGAGVIVGTRTFGKGVAQTVVDKETEPTYFPAGGGVRITSARFYSGDGIANDQIGVIPHLVVAEEQIDAVAELLHSQPPPGRNDGVIRLHGGSWRWYIDVEAALSREESRAALVELLECIWYDTPLFLGDGTGFWESIAPEKLAARLELTEFATREPTDSGGLYRPAFETLAIVGMLRGNEEGLVKPEKELTRAELCAMLSQIMNSHRRTWPSAGFSDVAEDAWYADEVNAAAANGLVKGDERGSFHPEAVLTQEELVVILSRFACWLNLPIRLEALAGPQGEILTHSYLMKYSDWAKEGAWLIGLSQNNMLGQTICFAHDEIQKLMPQEPATREMAVAGLFHLLYQTGGMEQ